MDAPTDEQLLREYLDGQEASFEVLVRRYTSELYQFAVRFTSDGASAEDVVQETFLRLHTSADRFDPARRFKPWLFTIAANKARDHLRRRERKREVSLEAPLDETGGTRQRFIDLFAAEGVPPHEDVALDEQGRLVREIVAEMPARLCEVLILAYYHRFPYKEIAEIVGVPLGTVKSRLHASITWLAERYRAAVADAE